jgi:hypothetical protein
VSDADKAGMPNGNSIRCRPLRFDLLRWMIAAAPKVIISSTGGMLLAI